MSLRFQLLIIARSAPKLRLSVPWCLDSVAKQVLCSRIHPALSIRGQPWSVRLSPGESDLQLTSSFPGQGLILFHSSLEAGRVQASESLCAFYLQPGGFWSLSLSPRGLQMATAMANVTLFQQSHPGAEKGCCFLVSFYLGRNFPGASLYVIGRCHVTRSQWQR